MRWNEIDEAPLADFGVSGDLDTAGSFRPTDLKAINNKKWVEKVHNIFSKTPFNFNVYVHNAENGIITLNGKVYDTRSFSDMNKYHGLIRMSEISKVIGFTPPNWEQSISVLILQNEGDERIGLTPWILAHRVAHAIMYADRSPTHMRNDDISNFLRHFDSDFQILLDGTAYKLAGISSEMTGNELLKAWAKQAGTFASARNGTIRDGGEFKVECFTQYLVQGKIVFNRPENPESPRTVAEEPNPLLDKARKYWNEHWRDNGRDFAKSVVRYVAQPRESYTAFDKSDEPIATFSANRVKDYEDRGFKVILHPVTSSDVKKYENYKKRFDAVALAYDNWMAEGKLKPVVTSLTDRMDSWFTQAESNLDEDCRRLLIRCIGKALVL